MEDYYLTKLLTKYRSGLTERKLLIREISLFVYNYPFKVCRMEEDMCSDFFCFFYPKIERMIDSFELRDVPFEAYLIKSIRLQLKTFSSHQKEGSLSLNMQRNMIFWPFWERTSDYCCGEEEYRYRAAPETISLLKKRLENSFSLTAEGTIRDRTLKKRVTMLILKNIFAVRDENFPFAANLIGREIQWLEDSRVKLKTAVEKRSLRKRKICERRNFQFCRLYILHQKLLYEALYREKELIALKIDKTKSKIIQLNKMIDSISQTPTHSDVAGIMNIPKGSIDSGLYYLKLYLEKK